MDIGFSKKCVIGQSKLSPDSGRVFDCRSYRPFGVEIELNSLNHGKVQLIEDYVALGSDVVANSIVESIQLPVGIHYWHSSHNNRNWVVKPDTSCGIEVCSPVSKGWRGLSRIMRVSKGFLDRGFIADDRCSLHVHVGINDLTKSQLASVIAHYIKCEHLIFDTIPGKRKNNRYCEFIGATDTFDTDFDMNYDSLINRISYFKYYSMNAYHFFLGGGFTQKNKRRTAIEFRVAGNEACLDPFYIKNWVRFLLHFVDVIKKVPCPRPYMNGDRWSGLAWLDLPDMFELLKFDKPLSEGMKQVKNWLIDRMILNQRRGGSHDVIFSEQGRSVAIRDLQRISRVSQEDSEDDRVFGKKYII